MHGRVNRAGAMRALRRSDERGTPRDVAWRPPSARATDRARVVRSDGYGSPRDVERAGPSLPSTRRGSGQAVRVTAEAIGRRTIFGRRDARRCKPSHEAGDGIGRS